VRQALGRAQPAGAAAALTLDFRDVFSEGFAFDTVAGTASINKGIATTDNLKMTGVTASVLMSGSADIARETQDLHVVVIPNSTSAPPRWWPWPSTRWLA
jgi:uncharacterized protein YhdP